jgi:predicted ATP-binding protein involved in virulence
MLLKSLDLKNFRCFKEFHIDFNDKLTVIVGQNGCGKSTILEAAAIAIGTFTAAMDDMPNYGIKKEDAHLAYYNMVIPLNHQRAYSDR